MDRPGPKGQWDPPADPGGVRLPKEQRYGPRWLRDDDDERRRSYALMVHDDDVNSPV